MASLGDLTRNDLRIMYRSALFLQSRLIRAGRSGPLLKLLEREIDLIKVELDRHREIEERRRELEERQRELERDNIYVNPTSDTKNTTN